MCEVTGQITPREILADYVSTEFTTFYLGLGESWQARWFRRMTEDWKPCECVMVCCMPEECPADDCWCDPADKGCECRHPSGDEAVDYTDLPQRLSYAPPIVVDAERKVLWNGHHRVFAALKLGLDTPIDFVQGEGYWSAEADCEEGCYQ